MAKSLLGKGSIKGRLCYEQMTLDNGHYLRLAIPTATWEEIRCPGLTGQGTLEFRILNVHITLSLSCVTADGGRVAGTQQHFGKGHAEAYGKASRKMGQWLAGERWQNVWYREGISPTERRALVTKLLWLENPQCEKCWRYTVCLCSCVFVSQGEKKFYLKTYIYLMCIGVLSAHTCVHHVHACSLPRSEEVTGSFGTM